MKRTRVSIDSIVIDGASDAQGAIASLRKALARHLQAPVSGAAPVAAQRAGSIQLGLPRQADSAAIASAIASAAAGVVHDPRPSKAGPRR